MGSLSKNALVVKRDRGQRRKRYLEGTRTNDTTIHKEDGRGPIGGGSSWKRGRGTGNLLASHHRSKNTSSREADINNTHEKDGH